ncbi:MAG: hypothetical protein QOK05_2307 [Chloroflexota bacterium]|nr:hypothetical protein [Chloroflexota bacterium]
MQLNSTPVFVPAPRGVTRTLYSRLGRRLANVVLAVGLAAAGSIPASLMAAVPARAAGFDAPAAEAQLISAINSDRAANGQGPLLVNPVLSNIARSAPHNVCGSGTLHGRSQDMIERNYFSHLIPPCSQYVWPILSSYGVQYSGAGENIGWNTYSPQSVAVSQVNTQFMNSSGHRANILGNFNQVGVGAYAAPGAWSGNGSALTGVIMFTEIFAMGPPPPVVAPPPTPAPSSLGPVCASSTPGSATPTLARNGHQLTTVNKDGRIEAFALGADGALWHSWESAVNGTWTSWYSLGKMSSGAFASDPAAGTNPDGRLEVFVTGSDGSVCHTWQLVPGGGWSQLSSLGSPGAGFTGISSFATNADGRMELFAVAPDGSAAHNWQLAPGGLSGWSGWNALGRPGAGSFKGSVAPGRNGDGRLEVTAVDANGAMFHAWQLAPSGAWSAWYGLSSPSSTVKILGTPGNTTNSDGRIESIARGSDNRLWHIWQVSPSGGWGPWSPLGGSGVASDPAAGRNGDGRLEVFTSASDGSVGHIFQTSPGGAWSPMMALASSGTSMAGTPQTQTNVDGTMEALAQDSLTQTMHMTKQYFPSGGWTPWATLTGTTFPAF